MEWLDESEKALDSDVEIANDPDKIKTQLAQHKVTESHPVVWYPPSLSLSHAEDIKNCCPDSS